MKDKTRSNIDIVVDTLRDGPKTVGQLAEALLHAGKKSSNYLASVAIRNARKPSNGGAVIVSLGKRRYALADAGSPQGTRFVDGVWQVRGSTRWVSTQCKSASEATEYRKQMEGVL